MEHSSPLAAAIARAEQIGATHLLPLLRAARAGTPPPDRAGRVGHPMTALDGCMISAMAAAADLAAAIDAGAEELEEKGAALADAFAGTDEDGGVRIAEAIGAGLESVARITGDWRGWATGWHYLPSPGRRAAAADLAQRLDAWSAQRRPQPDTPRKRLARLALALLREGVAGRAALASLDRANATFDEPLTPETIGAVLLWAARAAKEGRPNAAR